MHLAELNIAKPLYPLDDPRMADFTNNLERINALAERSPGFVWRMVADLPATDPKDGADENMISTLSVWEDAEALEHFVWNTAHAKIYNRKAEWFPRAAEAHFVMWPVAEGHQPTLDEALTKLADLRTNGSTPEAFGWDGLPHLKRWLEKRCG